MTNTWVDRGFISFDTETTGLDLADARIVTAAAIMFVGSEPVATRSWLLKVDVPVPPEAVAVHGVTTEMSQADGVDQAVGLADIRSFLVADGLPIVCFNSGFDIPLTNANLMRCGLEPLPSGSAICAYVIDRQMDKYVKGKAQRRLKPTAQRYGITLDDADWHGAEADAMAGGRIFLAEVAKFPQLASGTAEALSGRIDGWRAAQEKDFQDWLARQPPRD